MNKKLIPNIVLPAIFVFSVILNNGAAELLDRVVAVVNSEVILLSELQEAVEKSKASGEKKSDSEVLEEMISRTLLLEQALKFRVEMETYIQDEKEERKLINDYIHRRIKAFIHVPFEEIERYYLSHRDDFRERDLYESWDEIENRLKIERTKEKLDEHITLLKRGAYIRVQLNAD